MQEKVQKIIDKVRPYIQMHGGNVELLEIVESNPSTSSGQVVKLKVSGACAHCQLSDETFKVMLGGMIKEEVPEIKNLIIEN
jgi:Fe-S cluster biogenesis protein NfuA